LTGGRKNLDQETGYRRQEIGCRTVPPLEFILLNINFVILERNEGSSS
jgi:hypothetical protein